MKRKSNLLVLLALLFAATSLNALTPDEWKNRQSLDLDRPGPIKFALPATTIDAAQTDLKDLRIIDASGKETPYLLLKPSENTGRKIAPKKFRSELTDSATIITLETGTDQALDFVELETGAHGFLKPVEVEVSSDGEEWRLLDTNIPIFRQDNATKTTLPLARCVSAYVRLTINDTRSRPIAITGASLQTSSTQSTPSEPFSPRIVRAEEFTGETILTLDLGAANLSVSELEIAADDPLFARNVSISVRELQNGQIGERTIARGTIFRVAFSTVAPISGLHIPIESKISSRELLVHVENGDSPSLQIKEVLGRRNPLHIVIAPAAPGHLEIVTGNSQATAPHYDLAPLAAELDKLPLSTVRIGDPTLNSAYRQADPLAGLSLEGAPLDTSAWKHQRAVNTTKPGVQEIELDLHALANTQADYADIRLMQAGKQLPYVIERSDLSRDLIFSPVEDPDPKRPTVTRWKFPFPQPRLPLRQMIIHSPTKLFDRKIRVYEILKNELGEPYERTITTVTWVRTPDGKPQPLTIEMKGRMQTSSLWMETDNGDNPPIIFQRLQAFIPAVRMLCQTSGTEPIDMVYGNPAATAPRYDVSLISNLFLNAARTPAKLGSVQTIIPTPNPLQNAPSGVILWAVLAVVVVLLLILVAKLLPKPNNTP